ncbi:MAG: YfcE family phosphodiesterase [Acholeplasmatales bacterium]|jgi:putative phosphoesterase|nr:YfcE family phosphodiesterase [Acholeplasmatales bacterium]
MKVLITSDAHGNAKLFDAIVKKHPDVDMHIDLGDFLLDYHDYPQTTFIRGNRDTWSAKEEQLITTIDGVKILFVHGHLFHVKNNLRTLWAYASKNKVDVCYYGHTHKKGKNAIHKIMFINPGAVKDGFYLIANNDIVKFYNIHDQDETPN